MKIALYHPWIYVKSGLERTIMEIKQRSRHDWTIYTSHYDREGTYPELKQMGVVELDSVSIKRRYGAVLQAALTIARTRLDPARHDGVVVCCDGLGSFLNFRNRDKPLISLCFTPLRAVYDEEYKKRHLARLKPVLHPVAALAAWVFTRIDRRAWRYYQHAFCITETVRQRVLAGRLTTVDKTSIAFAGISGGKIAPSVVFEPFFFLPGRIMWTKNIELGIAAYRLFCENNPTRQFELIIAGMVDAKSQPYLDKLKVQAQGLRVRFETNLTDAGMADYYRRCHATLFTAFNEDQGLTPLEAGTHGKPVVAVNRGGPTEILRHEVSALLAEPDAPAFCAAMERLADDSALARQLGLGGAERCKLFTWEAFVEAIDSYLDTLAPT